MLKEIMELIVRFAAASFDTEAFFKIIEEFDGEVREELTSDGFKISFEKDGIEYFCALSERSGDIFYSIRPNHMGTHSGMCPYRKLEVKNFYNNYINRLLAA